MWRFNYLALLTTALVIVVTMVTIGGALSEPAPKPCSSIDEYAVADATGTQWHEWVQAAPGDRSFFDWVYTSSQAPKPGLIKVNQVGSFWTSKDLDLRGETIDASLPPDAGIGAKVVQTHAVHGALKLDGCGR